MGDWLVFDPDTVNVFSSLGGNQSTGSSENTGTDARSSSLGPLAGPFFPIKSQLTFSDHLQQQPVAELSGKFA